MDALSDDTLFKLPFCGLCLLCTSFVSCTDVVTDDVLEGDASVDDCELKVSLLSSYCRFSKFKPVSSSSLVLPSPATLPVPA